MHFAVSFSQCTHRRSLVGALVFEARRRNSVGYLGGDNKVGEALWQRLAVLIRRMLRERRGTTSLQESRLADIALDIHSLLVLNSQ